MTLKEIRELIELMRGSGVTELELERGGNRIRIRCGSSRLKTEAPSAPPPQQSVPSPPGPAPEPAAPVAEGTTGHLLTVASPIVGTFYRSAAPDAKPYVEEGETVEKGQVLCVIEAMKLMNEIECEVDGRIVKIIVDNAQPVEYGASLFLIEPL